MSMSVLTTLERQRCICLCETIAARDGRGKAEADRAGVQQRDSCMSHLNLADWHVA